MEEKNKNLIQEIIILIQSYISMIGDTYKLLILETKLTGKSLISILVLSFFIAFLVASLWISLIFVGSVSLLMNGWSAVSVLLSVLLLHLVIMLSLFLLLKSHQKNIGFPATQEQLGLNKEKIDDTAKESNSEARIAD